MIAKAGSNLSKGFFMKLIVSLLFSTLLSVSAFASGPSIITQLTCHNPNGPLITGFIMTFSATGDAQLVYQTFNGSIPSPEPVVQGVNAWNFSLPGLYTPDSKSFLSVPRCEGRCSDNCSARFFKKLGFIGWVPRASMLMLAIIA